MAIEKLYIVFLKASTASESKSKSLGMVRFLPAWSALIGYPSTGIRVRHPFQHHPHPLEMVNSPIGDAFICRDTQTDTGRVDLNSEGKDLPFCWGHTYGCETIEEEKAAPTGFGGGGIGRYKLVGADHRWADVSGDVRMETRAGWRRYLCHP